MVEFRLGLDHSFIMAFHLPIVIFIFFNGERGLTLIEIVNNSGILILQRSIIPVIIIIISAGLSRHAKHVSEHGEYGGSDESGLGQNKPNDGLFARRGGFAPHVLVVVEGGVDQNLVLVVENEVQHVDVLDQSVGADIDVGVGKVEQIEGAENVGQFSRLFLEEDREDGLLAVVASDGSVNDLDFQVHGLLHDAVFARSVEVDLVSLVLSAVEVDHGPEIPLVVLETHF